MKIQTLNAKQREKLLKLCEEFFPEYKFYKDERTSINYVCYLDNSNKFEGIHYFQLCLTELPKRIWESLWSKEQLKNSIPIIFILDEEFEGGNPIPEKLILSNKHPVDYLWNFVQECKKNKYFKNK